MADVITPMMQQYQRLRGSVPADVLLLFRLGAFYEYESASPARTIFGFAYADLTTGEFRLMQLNTRGALADELARVGPSEILVSEEQRDVFASIEHALTHDSYAFMPEQATFTLCEHFKTKSLDG